jgi:hypothetical protein
MKVTSLIKKLDKMNVTSEITKTNDVKFTISGEEFRAGFNGENVYCYYQEVGYDRANQVTERMWFNNLNDILSYVKSKNN